MKYDCSRRKKRRNKRRNNELLERAGKLIFPTLINSPHIWLVEQSKHWQIRQIQFRRRTMELWTPLGACLKYCQIQNGHPIKLIDLNQPAGQISRRGPAYRTKCIARDFPLMIVKLMPGVTDPPAPVPLGRLGRSVPMFRAAGAS